jgi:DNA-nicking Smr family endonuclease
MSNHNTSDDDKNLFRDAMQHVTPLKKTNIKPTTRNAPPVKPKQVIPSEPIKVSYYLSNHYTEEVGPNCTLSYHTPGLDKKRFLALKKGEILLQGHLDLHHLHMQEAQDRLCQFIIHHSQLGHRCVLVIHGKGSHNGKAPILKNAVNHWLKQLPEILAFYSALPRDGGAGALYVLLKRNREA